MRSELWASRNRLLRSERLNAMTAGYNVLFICTDNSVRSILAESLMNDWGQGRFRGYSAGSFPKGEIHPYAVELLTRLGLPTGDMRSKSWNEFAEPGAPDLDFVITLCDQAANERSPVWPGDPIIAEWLMADPAAIAGGNATQVPALRDALGVLWRRIIPFLDVRLLPDRETVESRVREIGRIGADREVMAHGDPAGDAFVIN